MIKKKPNENTNICVCVCVSGWVGGRTNIRTPPATCSRATRGPRATDYEPLLSPDRLKVGQHVRAHPSPTFTANKFPCQFPSTSHLPSLIIS